MRSTRRAAARWSRRPPSRAAIMPRCSWSCCRSWRAARRANCARRAFLRCAVIVQIGTHSLPGSFAFDDVMARGGAAERARLIRLAGLLQFDDPVNIQFTSGTTGSPKGATLTHHNLLNNGFFCGETMRYTHEDRLCIPVPLYHCFGNSIGVMACITHGSRHGVSRRGLRSAGGAADGAGGTLHVALRRADHVHRRDGAPGIRQIRPEVPAHRHDGRVALPDRGDAARHRA